MLKHEPLRVLPLDIQRDWLASLTSVEAVTGGFRLVGIQRTEGKSYLGQRITVQVFDENGFPLPNIQVAFSYSTAPPFLLTPDFTWTPPTPHRAFIARTGGGGQIDDVQGSVVKQGQPGGVTVYIFEPDYHSDFVSGCGMLADHTGLLLTFQLRRPGILPLDERLNSIEASLTRLENLIAEQKKSGGIKSE